MSSQGEFKFSVARNAMTIPKNTVCVIASATMDILRSTRNTPGKAHANAANIAIRIISVWADIDIALLPTPACLPMHPVTCNDAPSGRKQQAEQYHD